MFRSLDYAAALVRLWLGNREATLCCEMGCVVFLFRLVCSSYPCAIGGSGVHNGLTVLTHSLVADAPYLSASLVWDVLIGPLDNGVHRVRST